MSTFHTLAEYYDRLFPAQDETVRFLEATIPDPEAKLLDIGCGVGSHVRLLSDAGHDLLGIDSSAPMIAVGRQDCPNLAIQAMDMMEIDRLPDSYGMIYSLGNVVSHISADQLLHFLNSLHGLLDDQGIWLFQVVNWDKILRGGPPQFPEKRIDTDVIFRRRYENLRTNSVQFITELEVQGRVHHHQETLYPLTTDQYQSIHKRAGFTITAQYGNYARATYGRLTSGGNIMVFRKR